MADERFRWPRWSVQLVAGAFRGPRLAAVGASAALFALAALIALAQTGPTRSSHAARLDAEDVGVSGPLRVMLFIDTTGAPLRVRSEPPMEEDHGGWVGSTPELDVDLIVGKGKLHVRLVDPSGGISTRTPGPGTSPKLQERLLEQGVWRLELATRDARGLSINIGLYSVAAPSPFAAPQPVAALLIVLLCCSAVVMAPRPPRGARRAGELLAVLAATTPFVFFLAEIMGFPGTIATVAPLLAATLAGPAVLGWSFPRRSVRRGLGFAAAAALAGAVVLAIASAPGTDALGEGFFGLMNRERYDEAARLAAFTSVPVVLWLAGFLAGLASAPFRRAIPSEEREAGSWPQALDRRRLWIGAVTAFFLTLGLAWALTDASTGYPWVRSESGTEVARLLAVWIGLLGVALVAMSAGRRGVKIGSSTFLLIVLGALLLGTGAEDSMLPPYRSYEGMPRSTVVLTVCCLALAVLAGMLRGWIRPRRVPPRRPWVDAALLVCGVLGIWGAAAIADMPHSGENPGLPQDALVGLTWLGALLLLVGLWSVIGWRLGRWTAPRKHVGNRA